MGNVGGFSFWSFECTTISYDLPQAVAIAANIIRLDDGETTIVWIRGQRYFVTQKNAVSNWSRRNIM